MKSERYDQKKEPIERKLKELDNLKKAQIMDDINRAKAKIKNRS